MEVLSREYVAHLDEHLRVWPSVLVVTHAGIVAHTGIYNALDAFEDDEDSALRRAAMRWAMDELNDYEFLTNLGNSIGSVPRGFRTTEERNLVMNGISLVRNDGTLCTVCQETLSPETNAVELLCGHLYCRECIDKWLELSKRCPVCSKDQESLLYTPSS